MPASKYFPSIARLFNGQFDQNIVCVNDSRNYFWGKYYELEKGLWFSYKCFSITDVIIQYKLATKYNNYYVIDITISSEKLQRKIKQI